MKRVAVLIFNLGGPKEPADVEGFLYNLFKDKYIIGLPWGIRQGLAKLISSRRAASAQKNYAYMGGGSPIVAETEAQARALETYINTKTKGLEAKVFVGMRYWHPFIEETVSEIEAYDPDEIVLLPLYPQYSTTTTLSSFEAFKARYKGKAPVTYVCCYADNDHFIKAHADAIATRLKKIKIKSNYRLLFSAHGLPESIIAKGDPYKVQVEASVARIMASFEDMDHVVCYQSRVGPMKWIGPSTDEMIRQAGREGKSVVVIPIAFVSEHIETLVELDIEYAHLAKESGVKDYIRIPALGTAPGYIQALNDEVLKAIGSGTSIIGDHDCAACHSYCPKRRGIK